MHIYTSSFFKFRNKANFYSFLGASAGTGAPRNTQKIGTQCGCEYGYKNYESFGSLVGRYLWLQQASKYIDDDKITISPWLLGWLGPENVSCNKNNSVRDYQDWGVISKYPSIVKELEIFLYQPQYCKDHYNHSPDNQGSAVLPSKIHSQCIPQKFRVLSKSSNCIEVYRRIWMR